MTHYTIPQLEHLLTNHEHNDQESQKLYNNLGLAHAANHAYRPALKAHREEKRACKRLVAAQTPAPPALLLDLAIAYRRCGDVMLKLDRLLDARHVLISGRPDIIRAAAGQHRKGLQIARDVCAGGVAAKVEVQAACAAVAQSALALALETRDRGHFEAAAFACVEAALLAESLPKGVGGVTQAAKESMLLGISVNMAIALSGLGERAKAKTLLHAVAVRAKKAGDERNLVRAVSNLAEEAGEEEDWDLCEKFVREWIRVAKKRDDEADEADALRKLAIVLIEKRRFEDARDALERSLVIARTRQAQEEARRFLNVVEQEIEERKESEVELGELEAKAAKLEQEGNFVEEAKARMAAGNCAFQLQKPEDVARLLGRYFVLVDEYGCNTGVTEIADSVHNSAVANIGEAMWTMKRFEEAVKWATRELTVYGDDVAGQAQAWCNLGVYLDDYGKKENAVAALKQSIELAKKSGEEGVLKRAQNNLEVVQTFSSDVGEADEIGQDVIDPNVMGAIVSSDVVVQTEENNDAVRSGKKNVLEPSEVVMSNAAPLRDLNHCDDRSIIVDSSQPMKKLKDQFAGPVTDCSQGISSKRSRRERTSLHTSGATTKETGIGREPRGEVSRSHPSRGGTTGDRSSVGVNKFIDLASEYKAVCSKRQHPPVPPRVMVVNALRSLSSVLLAQGACDQPTNTPAKLDVSAMFMNNHDVSVLFETLSRLGGDHNILLDMRLNPMISPAAYECLNPRSFTSPSALHGIRKLDFSCAGVSASALRILSDALSEEGSLVNVTHLNISKNGLGREGSATAKAVARLLFCAAQLEVIDLSLNLLQNSFMPDLIGAIETSGRSAQGADISKSPVRNIDLHLNNRKSPTALLEVGSPSGIVDKFRSLFALMPGLESVDVRACGASSEMRRALRELASGFSSFSQNIVTVSPAVHDDLS